MQIAQDRQSRRTRNPLDPSTGTNEFVDDEVRNEDGGWDEEQTKIHCIDRRVVLSMDRLMCFGGGQDNRDMHVTPKCGAGSADGDSCDQRTQGISEI